MGFTTKCIHDFVSEVAFCSYKDWSMHQPEIHSSLTRGVVFVSTLFLIHILCACFISCGGGQQISLIWGGIWCDQHYVTSINFAFFIVVHLKFK